MTPQNIEEKCQHDWRQIEISMTDMTHKCSKCGSLKRDPESLVFPHSVALPSQEELAKWLWEQPDNKTNSLWKWEDMGTDEVLRKEFLRKATALIAVLNGKGE